MTDGRETTARGVLGQAIERPSTNGRRALDGVDVNALQDKAGDNAQMEPGR